MNIRVALAAVTALSLVASAVLADARSELQAIYNKSIQSYKKGDPSYIIGLQTADFKVKLPNGQTIGRAQANQQMRQGMKMVAKNKPNINVKISGLTTKGNTAVATVNSTASAQMKDPQGKMHKISNVSTERHTWVKTPKGWRVRLIQPLKSVSLMDGKPINIPNMPPPGARPKR